MGGRRCCAFQAILLLCTSLLSKHYGSTFAASYGASSPYMSDSSSNTFLVKNFHHIGQQLAKTSKTPKYNLSAFLARNLSGFRSHMQVFCSGKRTNTRAYHHSSAIGKLSKPFLLPHNALLFLIDARFRSGL